MLPSLAGTVKMSPRAVKTARLPSGEMSKSVIKLPTSAQCFRARGRSPGRYTVILRSFLALQIEEVKEPAVLKNDGVRSQAGPVDVVILEVGELASLLGLQAVTVKVHAVFRTSVGTEINRVAVPHGVSIGAGIIRDALVGVVLEVVDGDVLGHAARVALPGAEVAEDAVIGDLRAIRRKGGEPAFINGQPFRQAALDADAEEPPEPIVVSVAPGKKQDALAVREPGDDHVVRTHALGHARHIRQERQLFGFAAFRGNNVDVEVAVVLAEKAIHLPSGENFGNNSRPG